MSTTALTRSVAVLMLTAGTLVGLDGTGSAMMGGSAPNSPRGGGAPADTAPPAEPRPQPQKVEGEPAVPAGQRIVEIAGRQAGKPYVFGAEGPARFDCSGLVQYVHRQAGIDLPRTAARQRAAVPSVSHSAMRPGDLLFFHNGGRVYHVGIFAGSNAMWAAPEPGDVVRRQSVWTDSYTVGRAW
ncbi:C40 family peptidase [Saccharomonospora halophila]|uniref:C40 family peptidase n=1 Tax=Saccharomonospora halophila TaxID=129922 RepID=UPI0003A41AA3|nr:C40 family peptidase [Saccharomonospora halophila]